MLLFWTGFKRQLKRTASESFVFFSILFALLLAGIVLDEATCSMDSVSEKEMFRQCRLLDITCITVCHQAGLEKLHQQRIELDGEGGWSCSEVSSQRRHSRYGSNSSLGGGGAMGSTEVEVRGEEEDVEIDTLGGTVDEFE
jgi:ATP-binding cassette subfamily D (ALD) protein 4